MHQLVWQIQDVDLTWNSWFKHPEKECLRTVFANFFIDFGVQ